MKVMVLGGGSNQIDLIKKVKEQGDEAILIDYLPHCEGRKYADKHLLISTFDIDAVTQAARNEEVEAIVTSGTDQPVLTAASACEKLGLKYYINRSTAKAVTNKFVMKELFDSYNIPTARYRVIKRDFKDSELDDVKFPIVMKPADSQGQRGIYKLNSIEEVREKIGKTLSFSREDAVLVEEFYENDEITVNGWVKDGILNIISVVDRVTIKQGRHIGICLCHNYPSVYLESYGREIEVLTKKIVKSFNIKNGPIYFQYMVGKEGLKVNEIAMRIGGAYEGITIPLIAGIDILKMVLDYSKYGKADCSALEKYSLKNNKTFLSTQLLFCEPGKIDYITPAEKILSMPCVKAAKCEYMIGDTIKPLVNATARAGYLIIDGLNFEEMIHNVDRVFEEIEILDESGRNLIIKYSHYPEKYIMSDSFN